MMPRGLFFNENTLLENATDNTVSFHRGVLAREGSHYR
jgi:hypothetical protein